MHSFQYCLHLFLGYCSGMEISLGPGVQFVLEDLEGWKDRTREHAEPTIEMYIRRQTDSSKSRNGELLFTAAAETPISGRGTTYKDTTSQNLIILPSPPSIVPATTVLSAPPKSLVGDLGTRIRSGLWHRRCLATLCEELKRQCSRIQR